MIRRLLSQKHPMLDGAQSTMGMEVRSSAVLLTTRLTLSSQNPRKTNYSSSQRNTVKSISLSGSTMKNFSSRSNQANVLLPQLLQEHRVNTLTSSHSWDQLNFSVSIIMSERLQLQARESSNSSTQSPG